MKFKLADGEKVRTMRVTKAAGVVIAAGDLVELSSGLPIVATATAAAVAWCPAGGASADTVIEITVGNDFTLLGTMDVVFAVGYKGVAYDINTTTQYIDQGGTTYKVLKVSPEEDAGVVGSASNVKVRINAPIF